MSQSEPVDGIVLAAGQGERLGLGPKAWLTLGGRTLLERAVAMLRGICDHVFVGVAAGDVERARALCGADAVVVAGGATHRETMVATFRIGTAPLVLFHDVAHPFVTPALARSVLDAARDGSAAVAAVVSASSAYHAPPGAGRSRLGPGSVWLVRRPFACRRVDFARVAEKAQGEDGLSTLLESIGVHTALVRAAAWHIKVTTDDDWVLAQAIEETLRPV
jgi:2-C-methyl-D-erythritol 4-phosphate cytidylyltransferase